MNRLLRPTPPALLPALLIALLAGCDDSTADPSPDGDGTPPDGMVGVVADAMPETLSDTMPDGPPDASHDTITDVITDTITDTMPDSLPDAIIDATMDATPDAMPDAAVDAAADAEPEPGDPACLARCRTAADCRLVALDDCRADCADPRPLDDPLARRRAAERDACADLAGADCDALSRCLNPPGAAPLDTPTEFGDALCAAIDACQPGGCGLVRNLAEDRPLGILCLADLLAVGCPEDPIAAGLDCLDAEARACGDLCATRALCEPDLDPAACAEDCVARAVDGPEGDRRDQVAATGCTPAASCPALAECLDAASAAEACAAHCAALDPCGLAPDDCPAACLRDAPRAWYAAWRTCVADAPDCAAVADCAPPPRLPCARRCAVEAECRAPDPTCVGACEDAEVADREAALRTLACVLRAPACDDEEHSVARCLRDPDAGGGLCVGYCRGALGCDAPADALGACVEACGAGDFDRGVADRACLEDPLADCAALAACVAPEDPCPAFCAQAAGCAPVPDDCAATCAADPLLARLARHVVECLPDGGGCPAVDACLAVPPQPAPIDDAAFCARLATCPAAAAFGCDLALSFVGDGAVRRCVFEGLAACPDDPLQLLGECQATATAADPPCDRLCLAEHACGLADDAAACARRCRRARAAGGVPAGIDCADAIDCAALAACLGA